jgi:hypothetical protein
MLKYIISLIATTPLWAMIALSLEGWQLAAFAIAYAFAIVGQTAAAVITVLSCESKEEK